VTTALTPEAIHKAARDLDIAPEMLCTTCGRVAYGAQHFGHYVTRLDGKVGTTVPAPRLAPRTSPASPVRKAMPEPVVEWLTVLNVAQELGVSKMTVYRLVHNGEITGNRIGRSIRISRPAVNAYMAGSAVADETDEASA